MDGGRARLEGTCTPQKGEGHARPWRGGGHERIGGGACLGEGARLGGGGGGAPPAEGGARAVVGGRTLEPQVGL
jgi:hypothetical protein